MTQNEKAALPKVAFPKVGVGVSLYGSISQQFESNIRSLLQSGLPVLEIHGCAYQEMARGEICRRALVRREDGLKVVVITDERTQPAAHEIIALAEQAMDEGAIIATTREESDIERLSLDFAAIPVHLLAEVIAFERKKAAPGSPRAFFNSPGDSSLNPEHEFYPLFSPFNADGTSFGGSRRFSPDEAFLKRAALASVTVKAHRFTRSAPQGRAPRAVWRNRSAAKDGWVIAVACYGALDVEQRKLLWELQKHGTAILEVHGCAHIDVARDFMASAALGEGAAGVFMLDHDIIFRPQDLLDLCERAADKQAVVGAPYCMRKTGHSIIGAFVKGAGQKVQMFEGGGLEPAAYTGMGFTAIPRSIFERASKRMGAASLPLITELTASTGITSPPWFSLRVENGYYAGEDVSFCTRVHDIDGRQTSEGEWLMKPAEAGLIYLDTRVRIFHKGAYLYGIEDACFAVPRYSELTIDLTKTLEETRAAVREVDELPAAHRDRALGLDPELPKASSHPLSPRHLSKDKPEGEEHDELPAAHRDRALGLDPELPKQASHPLSP